MDIARKSPIDGRFIGILYLRSGMLSEGSAFSAENTCVLSNLEEEAAFPAPGLAGGSPPIAADIPARRAEGYLLGPRALPLTYVK